jgi:MYXO-CTERM domain-containing protein
MAVRSTGGIPLGPAISTGSGRETQMEQDLDLRQALSQGSLLESISRFAGGSREATKRTLDAALPVSMLGIAEHGSTEAGARTLLDGLKSGDAPQLDVKDVGQTLANPDASDRMLAQSAPILERVFGGRLSGLLDSLSQYGGFHQAGSSRILGLCAPLALGWIGRRALTNGLDAAGLAGFLKTLSPSLAAQVPEPLRSLFGHQERPEVKTRTTPSREGRLPESVTRRHAHRGVASTGGQPRWWPFALLGLAALFFIFWGMGRGCTARTQRAAAPVPRIQTRPAPSEPAPPRTQPAEPEAVAPPAEEPGAREKVRGTEEAKPQLQSNSVGIQQLSAYFTREENTPKRVVLDGLSFDRGQGSPMGAGQRVTDDLAALLLAHPDVRVRLERFTDSTGSAQLNQKLSQERADGVKSQLVDQGVAPDRIEATGMGDKDPVASNNTQAGRAQNRRVEAVVTVQ